MSWKQVTKDNLCPISGSDHWCAVSDDGQAVCCKRDVEAPQDTRFEFVKQGVDQSGGDFYLWRIPSVPNPPKYSMADNRRLPTDEEKDLVYSKFLGGIPQGIETVRRLQARDISLSEINSRGYKPLGKSRAKGIKACIDAGLEHLLPMVPGFCLKDGKHGKYWSFRGRSGILIPIRNAAGLIVAIKIRSSDSKSKQKYYWASSSGKDIDGKEIGGNGPGSPIHFPERPDGCDTRTVRITEGPLKGDIATTKTGILTLAMPGVRSYRKARAAYKEVGATTVLVALDMDWDTNADVTNACRNLIKELAKDKVEVLIEVWDRQHKGIDDALKAGCEIQRLTPSQFLPLLPQSTVLARSSPGPQSTVVNESPDDPHLLARNFLLKRCGPDTKSFHFHAGQFYEYTESDGVYRLVSPDEISASLTRSIKQHFDDVNLDEVEAYNALPDNKGEPPPKARKVTRRLVSDARGSLESLAFLPSSVEAPAWINGAAAAFPPNEILVAQGCLVHLPSLVGNVPGAIIPPTPNFFTFNSLGYHFYEDAPRPNVWLEFLRTLWPNDPASIDTLQEVFGYLITNDTSQQKIFGIFGPPRSGKGTILRILRMVAGESNCCGPTLSSLAMNFGLWALVSKMIGIISDARLGNRADAASIVERLLAISGEDALTIDRKNLQPITVKLPTRFLLVSNELPRLTDASGALASRLLVLQLTESFLGREDTFLTDKLQAELPSILLWSIEGWRRLRARGHFIQPETSAETVRELGDLTSPIRAFVRDECELGPFDVTCKDLFDSWCHWCKEVGKEHTGDQASLGKNLRSAVPSLRKFQKRNGYNRIWCYGGIKIAVKDSSESQAGTSDNTTSRMYQDETLIESKEGQSSISCNGVSLVTSCDSNWGPSWLRNFVIDLMDFSAANLADDTVPRVEQASHPEPTPAPALAPADPEPAVEPSPAVFVRFGNGLIETLRNGHLPIGARHWSIDREHWHLAETWSSREAVDHG